MPDALRLKNGTACIGLAKRKKSQRHSESTLPVIKTFVDKVSFLGGQCSRHPIEALIESISCCRACRLDEPLPVAHVVQSELRGDFSSGHGIRQVLLVCKDQHHCITHLIII